MDKESPHEVLTVKEVGSLLRVNSSTIYKLIRAGQIPTFRVGSEWRFRRDRIERWMAERTMGSESHRAAPPGSKRRVLERTSVISQNTAARIGQCGTDAAGERNDVVVQRAIGAIRHDLDRRKDERIPVTH